MITISLILNTIPKGPGYWKPNSFFRTKHEYINENKAVLGKVTEEYKKNNEDSVMLYYGK